MKSQMLLLCALLSMGCGIGQESSAETPAVSSQALSIPTQPTLYKPGFKFFASAPASAITVVSQDPTNAKAYLAYGFDVKNQKCAFFIRGDLAELKVMTTELNEQLRLFEQKDPLFHGSAVVSQTGKPPRPPQPGGTDGSVAYELATRVFNAL